MTIEEKVKEINAIIRKDLWMDMDLSSWSGGVLTIIGGIDLSVSYTIELVFKDVYWASIHQSWNTNTKRDTLFLVEGEEEWVLNGRFNIEVGYSLFKIITEHYTEPIYIAAKDIKYLTEKVYL